jgi:hypothetical protein
MPKTKKISIVLSPLGRLTVIGTRTKGGSYVLRLRVGRKSQISCGSFNRGMAVTFQPGDYLYMGSAMSQAGAMCLARRLVRHATRLDGRMSHPIRELMLAEFPRLGLCDGEVVPPATKRVKWHVHRVLDHDAVKAAD